MQNLPKASVYDQEAKYMPWGILVKEIVDRLADELKPNAQVVDLMCGTGGLLAALNARRPDLSYLGVDHDHGFIRFAKKNVRGVGFLKQSVFLFQGSGEYDAVLCTGGLHHVHWDRQDQLIDKFRSLIKPGGFALVADPYIADYKNDNERMEAAAVLGHEYFLATLRNGAPRAVLDATLKLIPNDVFGVEFKTSLKLMQPKFHKHFGHTECYRTWPQSYSKYGDHYFILSP